MFENFDLKFPRSMIFFLIIFKENAHRPKLTNNLGHNCFSRKKIDFQFHPRFLLLNLSGKVFRKLIFQTSATQED